jgi:hypothetical protein
MRRMSPVPVAIAILLCLAACSSGQAICTSAGGTYSVGTCTEEGYIFGDRIAARSARVDPSAPQSASGSSSGSSAAGHRATHVPH